MIDPRENHGAVMELKRLAIQKVWDITEDEAETFATSGLSLFAWMNTSELGAAWRERVYARHERKLTTRLQKAWLALERLFAKEQS